MNHAFKESSDFHGLEDTRSKIEIAGGSMEKKKRDLHPQAARPSRAAQREGREGQRGAGARGAGQRGLKPGAAGPRGYPALWEGDLAYSILEIRIEGEGVF